MNIIERIVLMVVVVALFRPDAIMDRIYPQYAAVDFSQITAPNSATLPVDRAVRLYVTREMEYGDRFKLFVIPPLETNTNGTLSLSDRVGLTLTPEPDDRLNVSNTQFNGPADTIGITFGDLVTSVEIEEVNRPAKEWVYLFGSPLLAMVFFYQTVKARRLDSSEIKEVTA